MDEEKKSAPTVNNAELASGITFGVRGCLTTLAGFFLGAIVGVSLTVLLTVGPGYNWIEDAIIFLVAFGGGVLGAIFGTLFGVIIGTKRR